MRVLVLALLLLAVAGCPGNGDATPDGGEPDAGEPDAGEPDASEPDAGDPDASDVDGPVDAPPETDASTDATIDAPIDGVPPMGWGVTVPGVNAMDVVTVGDRTYLLTLGDSSPFLARLHTIVAGQVTATETFVNAGGRLGTDGQSLYVTLGFSGVVTLWGEQVGVAGRDTVIVAKLGANGQPIWRYVDTYTLAEDVWDFQVAANGTSALVFRRDGSSPVTRSVDVLSADGIRTLRRTLPDTKDLAIDDDGDVFVSGVLAAGASLEGHVAAVDESYLIKLVGDTVGFTRFMPGVTQQIAGIHDGDPMIASDPTIGTHTIARHSGTSGAPLWTTSYEGGGAQFRRRVVSGGAGAVFLFGRFQERLDFSPTVRLVGQVDSDIYVAELDPVSGVARRAHKLGSAGYDDGVELERGTCPLVAGTLRGMLVYGQGVLAVPAGGQGAFVATFCP